jgi:hypothetical protein
MSTSRLLCNGIDWQITYLIPRETDGSVFANLSQKIDHCDHIASETVDEGYYLLGYNAV